MVEYLRTYRPRISCSIGALIFILSFLSIFGIPIIFGLYPSTLYQYQSWYRFLTYSFFTGSIFNASFAAVMLIGCGYVIENRLPESIVLILIVFCIWAGGLIFSVVGLWQGIDVPIMGATHIVTGYTTVVVTCGGHLLNEFNRFEKVVYGMSCFSVFLALIECMYWEGSLGLTLSTIGIIAPVFLFFMICNPFKSISVKAQNKV